MKHCNHENYVTIIEQWSYFCLGCGKYIYDSPSNVQNKKKTIEHLKGQYDLTNAKKYLILSCIEIAKLK